MVVCYQFLIVYFLLNFPMVCSWFIMVHFPFNRSSISTHVVQHVCVCVCVCVYVCFIYNGMFSSIHKCVFIVCVFNSFWYRSLKFMNVCASFMVVYYGFKFHKCVFHLKNPHLFSFVCSKALIQFVLIINLKFMFMFSSIL
jgi:hypothetical protein